ncbi:ABC transporter permease [Paenibacillus hodogayensis]|uniref:ABC transporter permease n=1 Tax=Paenibacillus hodogayensis TaxID=279208 RepID=A0ABV5W459_9BACL
MQEQNLWEAVWGVIRDQPEMILTGLWQHIYISMLSMIIAILIAVPLGICLTRYRKVADGVIGFAGMFQTIPSIALFGFLMPLVGIGVKPTIIALVLYALAPIVRNVYTGIVEVNPATVDAGRGMGMTNWQILRMIELPLALPVIMAGIRTATIWTIGITTIAAFIGAGGLGQIIFRGVTLMRPELVLSGAIPAALLAIVVEVLLKKLEARATRKRNPLPQAAQNVKDKSAKAA